MNTNNFIEKSKKIHGNKYDYSLVEYENHFTNVKIICKIHGIFEQTPRHHLMGRGCQKCGGSLKKTTEEFIEKSKKIHGNKYDYSLVEYVNIKNKVKIICPVHGVFEQSPESHLNGCGCSKCNFDKQRSSKNFFIEKSKKIHGDKYNYSLIEYKDNNTKVKIICPKHGIFEQKPRHHISGQGCMICKQINMKLSLNDFIERSNIIHDYFYDYSEVEYLNNYTKVKIICSKHGIFKQTPNFHLLGQGCPSCKKSLIENEIAKILDIFNINYFRQYKFSDCKNIKPLPFDFYLPDKKLVIEYNGKQHYEPIKWFGGNNTLNYIRKNDNIKKKYCTDNDIKYIEISYKDNKKINDIIYEILFK